MSQQFSNIFQCFYQEKVPCFASKELCFFLIMHRYKRSDDSTKNRRASVQSGTGKGSQKNSGIGFDSRSSKGKSKVNISQALVRLITATELRIAGKLFAGCLVSKSHFSRVYFLYVISISLEYGTSLTRQPHGHDVKMFVQRAIGITHDLILVLM